MPMLLDLFLTFARVGGLTFGGGLAMLPMLQRELVNKKGWATEQEIADWFALGQCVPGIIAINVSTFAGQKMKGIWGGICATLGMVTPSIIVITIIAAVLQNFADLPVVQNAFAGIRACVCGLILGSVSKLWKNSVVDIPTGVILLVVFLGAVFLGISPPVFILLAVGAGITIQLVKGREAKKG